MGGGLIGCPKFKLIFEKEGYERVVVKYRSCCTSNDTIKLIKNKMKNYENH
jgi:hypothetical protein